MDAQDIVYGESRNRAAAQALAHQLRDCVEHGTLYLGYPVLATADERVEVDALLVSADRGLIAFLLPDVLPDSPESWDDLIQQQDKLYSVLVSNLGRHASLRTGRTLAVTPVTATIFPAPVRDVPPGAEGFFGALEDVPAWVQSQDGINGDIERSLQAALQRVTTIKPAKKRAAVTDAHSLGGKLKEIEKGIANLDRWQKAAAIESPDGPQRIRGLAGSGKTVVLALKAAYWHTQHPEWKIALTFHTRALYQQIDDLVTRFTFEHSNDKPDREALNIVHSWGSRHRSGVYSLIAQALGEDPRDWTYARQKYGMDDAFQGICRELLEAAKSRDIEPIFDAVLIDEAQDLPPEFFQLVYKFTREPKRIVWGYDELQKLSEAAMPDTSELFGLGPDGQVLVSLENPENGPRRDVVLPICYRNTPWALATAHALGIGTYRNGGLVQHPDVPELWRDVGYRVHSGELRAGAAVSLERRPDSYPKYFDEVMTAEEAVVTMRFTDEQEQDAWVVEKILENVTSDELDPDDILIVLPDTYRAKSRAPRLVKLLSSRGLTAHLVGVDSSVDEVFRPGSIAIAHIFRAKGNEAPMVYVVDAQYAASDLNALTRRNTLFTAITRSRGWVRITGWGDRMDLIAGEIEEVTRRRYRLEFTVPTADELDRLRHTHRDLPMEVERTLSKAQEGLDALLAAFDRGELDFQDLPAALRTRLALAMRATSEDDNS